MRVAGSWPACSCACDTSLGGTRVPATWTRSLAAWPSGAATAAAKAPVTMNFVSFMTLPFDCGDSDLDARPPVLLPAAKMSVDIRGRPGFDVVGSPAELQAEVAGWPRKSTGKHVSAKNDLALA